MNVLCRVLLPFSNVANSVTAINSSDASVNKDLTTSHSFERNQQIFGGLVLLKTFNINNNSKLAVTLAPCMFACKFSFGFLGPSFVISKLFKAELLYKLNTGEERGARSF